MKTGLQIIIFVLSFTTSRHPVDWMLKKKTGVSSKVRYCNILFFLIFLKNKCCFIVYIYSALLALLFIIASNIIAIVH